MLPTQGSEGKVFGVVASGAHQRSLNIPRFTAEGSGLRAVGVLEGSESIEPN